jgi:hypothetical protein
MCNTSNERKPPKPYASLVCCLSFFIRMHIVEPLLSLYIVVLLPLSKFVFLQCHILLHFLVCICFVVSLVFLFNVYCSYTRWFRVWSQRYHFEYLTFYCAIEKGEFKDLHQLKKDMFNFIVVSNICFVVHIVCYYNEER